MKTSNDICAPRRRQAVLTKRRRLKMAYSAHSYVPGRTLQFYEWLGSSPARSLPLGVVGAAHAQQMDRDARKKWQMVLKQNRSKKLDAPSWLWTSVVELVARHESAYLEHCRQYALNGTQS
jgi:uncharacterized protein (DUF2252 family)